MCCPLGCTRVVLFLVVLLAKHAIEKGELSSGKRENVEKQQYGANSIHCG